MNAEQKTDHPEIGRVLGRKMSECTRLVGGWFILDVCWRRLGYPRKNFY